MTNKAEMLALEELHNLTAIELTKVLREGVPIIDKETGEVVDRAPASAAYFATAIKFLKDNDITADPASSKPLQGLVGNLPTFDEDESPYPAH